MESTRAWLGCCRMVQNGGPKTAVCLVVFVPGGQFLYLRRFGDRLRETLNRIWACRRTRRTGARRRKPKNNSAGAVEVLFSSGGQTADDLIERAAPAPQAPQTRAADDGLSVVSIAKSYDKRSVLSDVSLSVGRGEVVGLLGPNGAGKTTCFYSIMGLVRPDSGRILMDGIDVTRLPMYRRAILGLGYLPQETSIFRGLTVEQNIAAVLELNEPDPDARSADLERLLDEFGLVRLRSSAAMALSGGERRRCEIARALAAKPSIMLLDEPFAGIDPLSINDIRTLVKDLSQRGIGVLITDHNVRETLEIVDRAYILHDGLVLKEGTPDEIVNDDTVPHNIYSTSKGNEFNLGSQSPGSSTNVTFNEAGETLVMCAKGCGSCSK